VERAQAAEQPTSSPEREAHVLRNSLIWTGVLAAMLLGVGLAVPDLRGVLDDVSHAGLGWLVLAVALELISCLGYVATVRLVLSRGPAREVRRLAWAEMAFGAVVPVGGAGGLAVGAWAMRAWGATWAMIADRSAVIFLLTTAVNASVLALAGVGLLAGIGSSSLSIELEVIPAAIAIAGLAFFVLLPTLIGERAHRGVLGRLLAPTAGWVRATEAVAFKPNWRLVGTISYLVADIFVLWACMRAVGTDPPILPLVLGYQVGYLANLLPIPGGIGVLEGGLAAALILYGMPAAPTAAAVILYHAIALWIPALGGTIGFARLRGAVAAGERLKGLPGQGSAPTPRPLPAGAAVDGAAPAASPQAAAAA
jgi:uncharacterized membrane protein YbhN (UPF0104 family)